MTGQVQTPGSRVDRFVQWSQRVGLGSAAVPALVVAVVIVAITSALLFNRAVDAWFAQGLRAAVAESRAVADAYVDEHRAVIRDEALAMAADLSRDAARLFSNPSWFSQVISTQASLRALVEAAVVHRSGDVLARTSASVAMSESVSTGLMDRAKDGEVIVLVDQGDRVRALVKLDGFVDAYLFIGRHIDPRVLAHRERTSLAMLAYEGIESRRVKVQRTFMAINIVATLLLLPTAVWLGLMLAARPRGAPPEAPSKPAETSS